MPRLTRRPVLRAGALAALAVLVAGGARAAFAQDAAAPVPAEGPSIGRPDAPVTIVEYSSLTCPHCAEFSNDVLPGLKAKYIDTGKVRLVLRDFPLDRVALEAAQIAHCAGPQRYPTFVEVMFRTQEQWARAADPSAALRQIGQTGGLSAEKLDACLADQALADRILQTSLEGQQTFNIESTPSFIIGDEVYAGSRSVEGFSEIIDPLLGEG